MQPGKHSFSMFGRFLSINPPQPELLFDVKREHKANSDYSDTGYPYIHNYGSAGGGAAYACSAANLKSPELYYNPWVFYNTAIEAISLADGVFHVTKLLAVGGPRTIFNVKLNNFVGFNSKISIFISKPVGKENTSDASFSMGADGWEDTPFSQALTDGVNVIEIPDSSVFDSQYNNIVRVAIPGDWWDKDENDNAIETNTDFYVIFFPVLDESQCNGYGEYLCPRFNDNSWNKKVEEIVLSDDGLTVDTTLATDSYDLLYSPTPYYSDEYIVVYSPEFLNVYSSTNADIIFEALTYSTSGGYLPLYSKTLGSTNGKNTPFYGCVIFKEDYTGFINQIRFSAKGVFTMLPYNNDRFTVAYSGNNTNLATIQVNETTPFHDKCELQTLITKYRNTYKGSSILYRNEVLSTSEDLLGIYGFRLSSYAENSTQYSHRHCILDAAQGRWENLVSYCNNTIVTNQITDYELLYKDTVSAVVLLNNEEITDEDCSDTGSRLFSCIDGNNCFSGQLYYLIAFKERLTPWQIAYQIKQMTE